SASIDLHLGSDGQPDGDHQLDLTLRPPAGLAQPAEVKLSLKVADADRLEGDVLVLVLWTGEAEAGAKRLESQLNDFKAAGARTLVGGGPFVVGADKIARPAPAGWPLGLKPFKNQSVQEVL